MSHFLLNSSSVSSVLFAANKPLREMKQLGKPCNSVCVHQCTKIINEAQRAQILKYFHGLEDPNLQRLFIQKCVERDAEKESDSVYHRYFFTINRRRIRVCKLFFISTLAIKPSFILEALNADFGKEPAKEKEKEDKKSNPKIVEGVINHIKSIPRIISCNIDKNGEREYIETSINVETMYQLYIKYSKTHNYPQATFEVYSEVFTSKNEIFKKCQESVPLLGPNEVTLITLKADSKST